MAKDTEGKAAKAATHDPAAEPAPAGLPPHDGDEPDRRARHGTPRAADAGGPVPRFVNPLDRAPQGYKRFKVRCDNWNPTGVRLTRYVLAKDEESARAFYTKAVGIDDAVRNERAALKASNLPEDRLEPVRLSVRELPD